MWALFDRLVRLGISQGPSMVDIRRTGGLIVVFPVLNEDPLDLVEVRLQRVEEPPGLKVF